MNYLINKVILSTISLHLESICCHEDSHPRLPIEQYSINQLASMHTQIQHTLLKT